MAGRAAAAAWFLAALVAAAPASAQAERRFAVHGMVLRVDRPARTFVVSHERIDGLMAAMTMPFEVRDARQLDGLGPGATVDFLLVLGAAAGYATDVRIRRYEPAEPEPQPARLPADRRAAGRLPPPVAPGQIVPDFTLTDSAGRPVRLSSFAGKVVAVNFLYTRCGLPQFCPRMAATFAAVQARFGTVLGRDVQLLTVTFDPERDTPEVLGAYAKQWKADGAGWRFLTGPVDDVRRVGAYFGLGARPDDRQAAHVTRTAIIGRDGRLAAGVEGNRFTPEQFGDLLRSVLEP